MAQVQYTQGQLKVPSQSNLSGGTKSSYSGLSKKLLKVVRFEIGLVLFTDTEQLGTRFLSAHLTRDLSPWVKEFRRIMNLSDLNGTKVVLADSGGPKFESRLTRNQHKVSPDWLSPGPRPDPGAGRSRCRAPRTLSRRP